MKFRYTKFKIICIGVVVTFVFSVILAVFNVTDWLRGNDSPVISQAAIVLSGPPTRALYAADLYKAGYVKEIYITRPIREDFAKMLDDFGIFFPRTEDMSKDILLKNNVAAEHIHIVGNACVSTADEADVANTIFKGAQCTILVVSSPYHVKRAQIIFRDKMKHCQFKVLGSPYEHFPKKWWTDQNSAANVILEPAKILFYKLGGRFKNSSK